MNVFLDTMVYLHCVPLEELDLCKLTGSEEVTIVVPRITLKELDKHKNTHPSSRVRDRAARILKELERLDGTGERVAPTVAIKFITEAHKLDMADYGLSSDWNDDLLIASVLECKSRESGVESVVVSQDTGARMTCRHLGIVAFEVPPEKLLSPELDETEKENRRLRRELDLLKNALPRIVVGFSETMSPSGIFKVSRPVDLTEERVAELLKTREQEIPLNPKGTLPQNDEQSESLASKAKVFAAYAKAIPEEEFERYRTEREDYFSKYEEYLKQAIKARNRWSRSIRFEISINNEGTAPADDIDIYLHFPDGFSLIQYDDYPKPPEEPKLPEEPKTSLQRLQESLALQKYMYRQPDFTRYFDQTPKLTIRETNSYEVTHHFDRIKHGFVASLPAMVITFNSFEEAHSFSCEYEVNVANVPEAIAGKLNFRVDCEE